MTKVLFGLFAVLLEFGDYIAYFWGIFKQKTKPHFFTWLIWSISIGTAFGIQVVHGAGAGAWATGVNAVACCTIAAIAFFQKNTSYTVIDWAALLVALLALGLWLIEDRPLIAVLLIIMVDASGYVPMFKKSFRDPRSEPILAYIFASVKYIPALLAMGNFTLLTALYPTSIAFFNMSFALFLFIRQKQLPQKPQ